MRKFDSLEDVDSLTDREALNVIQMAGNRVGFLLETYGAYGLDDRGDYLAAALENYHRLFDLYWMNDGDSGEVIAGVKLFLMEHPAEWLGADGEIRFDLFTERFVEADRR